MHVSVPNRWRVSCHDWQRCSKCMCPTKKANYAVCFLCMVSDDLPCVSFTWLASHAVCLENDDFCHLQSLLALSLHMRYLLGRLCGHLPVGRIRLSTAFLLPHLHLTNWSAATFWQNFLLCSPIFATLASGNLWHGHVFYIGYSNHMDSCSAHYFLQTTGQTPAFNNMACVPCMLKSVWCIATSFFLALPPLRRQFSMHLYPLYTGAATFVPPLCDHKTGEVAVEGAEEAERLPWSFKGGTEDVQTSPWTPWSPWSFEHVQNNRSKVAEEVGRSKEAGGRHAHRRGRRMDAHGSAIGRPVK